MLALLVLGLASVFLLTGLRIPSSDGAVRYQTFLTLFSDSPQYSKYSTVQPLLAKLLDLPVKYFFSDLPDDFAPRLLEPLVILMLVVVAAVRIKDRWTVVIASGLLPLSMISHYLGQFFSETTSAVLLATGFVIFLTGKRYHSTMIGGAIAALGLANWFVLMGPMGIIVCMALLGFFTGREKDFRFLIFLLTAFAIASLLILSDLWFKGQLFASPYTSNGEAGFKTVMPYSGLPGFSHPLFIGLIGSLFSFGKSIFLFNPFLFFLFVRDYRFKPYMLAGLASALLTYSQWWAWYGGFSFGTRFYMFAVIPSIFVFIIGMQDKNRRWKPLEIAAILLAIWLAICGKYFGLDDVAGICTQDDYAMEPLCWYVPEFTPLINPIVTHGLSGVLERVSWHDYLYIVAVLCLYFALRSQRENGTVGHKTPTPRTPPVPR